MKMYNIILCFFFVSITCSCSANYSSTEKSSSALSVNIKLLKEYYVPDSIYIGFDYESLPRYINNKRYDILITIENSSDTIINILMMTCSWDKNIIINTPFINYVREDCNNNYTHSITIKPHEQFTLPATLEKSKHIDECTTCSGYSKTVILKLGLIYIPRINDKAFFPEYDLIMNDKSLWNIIWSNPLNIEKQ